MKFCSPPDEGGFAVARPQRVSPPPEQRLPGTPAQYTEGSPSGRVLKRLCTQ